MKLWVVLVAATLLAGCGAELDPPESAALPPQRIWGYLGEVAENATARLRGAPLIQKLQSLVETLRAEAAEARDRVAEYGAEARAALEQTWGDLKNRGVTYSRKLRRRLSRDGDELRRRWDSYGQALGDKMAALRQSWGARRGAGDPGAGEPGEPQVLAA